MTAYAGPARLQLPTLQRADLLPTLSFGAALALPLALVVLCVF